MKTITLLTESFLKRILIEALKEFSHFIPNYQLLQLIGVKMKGVHAFSMDVN